MKRFSFFVYIFLIISNLYGIRVGLDSGHSIKELYKSGGAFNIQKRIWNSQKQIYENITLSYYPVAWPAGGIKLTKMSCPSGIPRRRTYVFMKSSVEIPDWDEHCYSQNKISFKEVIKKYWVNGGKVLLCTGGGNAHSRWSIM